MSCARTALSLLTHGYIDGSPSLTHWRYYSLALSHRYIVQQSISPSIYHLAERGITIKNWPKPDHYRYFSIFKYRVQILSAAILDSACSGKCIPILHDFLYLRGGGGGILAKSPSWLLNYYQCLAQDEAWRFRWYIFVLLGLRECRLSPACNQYIKS